MCTRFACTNQKNVNIYKYRYIYIYIKKKKNKHRVREGSVGSNAIGCVDIMSFVVFG